MAENKIAKIPVASHGLHKHSYNYPWLSSINFGDVMPCYINTVRKGEHDHPKAGVFSQLMPIAHNAFATGRYKFKGIFVPYKLVWRPWYSFDQQTDYYSNGVQSIPSSYPWVNMGAFSEAFVKDYTELGGTNPNSYDLVYHKTDQTNENRKVLPVGRRILRVLMALGCTPSFDQGDSHRLNILPIMCYIKAFADYFFPNQYVGNYQWNLLSVAFNRDDTVYNSEIGTILAALDICSRGYYDNSFFDNVWDNPTSPNVHATVPSVSIPDVSNDASIKQVVTNDSSISVPSNSGTKPSNGTPFVGSVGGTGNFTVTSVLTQYVVDSLKSLALWTKRHQIAGARILERFLVSRGISLGDDSALNSYLVASKSIEIEVSAVENNTDSNLGELAGRGVASSGNTPLSFDCKADDDGIFLVLVSAEPDANFPVYLDGFACRTDFLDNYNAEFDKLGPAAVPSRICNQRLDGNYGSNDTVFGFANMYWDEVQERPRLLGDFVLNSQGAVELSAYHTFRKLNYSNQTHHSYDFVSMTDSEQYQRLFYNNQQENLMLFLRWYGEQFKEKLPLGDSYDWDDDELNKKVTVAIGGSQK